MSGSPLWLIVVGSLALAAALTLLAVWLWRRLSGQRRAYRRDLEIASQVIDALPDALVIVDHAGRVSLVNHECEVLFGYSRADLLGQPLDMLLPERIRGAHTTHMATYFREPERRPMGTPGMRLVGLHRDGDEFPIEVRLGYLRAGQVYGVALVRRARGHRGESARSGDRRP